MPDKKRTRKRGDGQELTPDSSTELLPSAAQTLARIREILIRARHQALQTVDTIMVRTYWEIGQQIVEEEQRGSTRAGYGTHLIDNLARHLIEEFGSGYHPRNLAYMRQFYQTHQNLNALRSELSWTHHRLLLRVRNPDARAFYEKESIRANWATRELNRQINSMLYERYALSRDKEGVLRLAQQGAEAAVPEDILRDPFVTEFTGLQVRERYSEKNLEDALMDRLQSFLLELGTDFFFVARQKRLPFAENEKAKVDLVFYHRTLRCFVLIDLKIGQVSSHDVGQMLAYVGYYEVNEMREGENPPIGILLGADTNRAAVRYALTGSTQKIFAARYQLYLPTEEELRRQVIQTRDDFLLEHSLERSVDNEPQEDEPEESS